LWLSVYGFTPDNTLFANATCRDEINTRSVQIFADHWGEDFKLAGLGGYPSAGLTGFLAYAHHMPDAGNLFILYGSHVGVSAEGVLGRVQRSGMAHESGSCGALLSLLDKLTRTPRYTVKEDPLDAEQNTLEKALLASAADVLGAQDPLLTLTERAFDVIDDVLRRIIERAAMTCPVALLGGITFNTPGSFDDCFVPYRAEVLNAGGQAGRRESGLSELTSA
jgi:hypothetical protein